MNSPAAVTHDERATRLLRELRRELTQMAANRPDREQNLRLVDAHLNGLSKVVKTFRQT